MLSLILLHFMEIYWPWDYPSNTTPARTMMTIEIMIKRDSLKCHIIEPTNASTKSLVKERDQYSGPSSDALYRASIKRTAEEAIKPQWLWLSVTSVVQLLSSSCSMAWQGISPSCTLPVGRPLVDLLTTEDPHAGSTDPCAVKHHGGWQSKKPLCIHKLRYTHVEHARRHAFSARSIRAAAPSRSHLLTHHSDNK